MLTAETAQVRPLPFRPESPSCRNEDVTLVDRSTQTLPHVPLFLPTGPSQQTTLLLPGPPSLFTLSPTKHIKVRAPT